MVSCMNNEDVTRSVTALGNTNHDDLSTDASWQSSDDRTFGKKMGNSEVEALLQIISPERNEKCSCSSHENSF